MNGPHVRWLEQKQAEFDVFYETHFLKLSEALEVRRGRYLRYFYSSLVVCGLLLLLTPVYFPPFYDWLNNLGQEENPYILYESSKKLLRGEDLGLYVIGLFWVAGLLFFITYPVVRYRKYVMSRGDTNKGLWYDILVAFSRGVSFKQKCNDILSLLLAPVRLVIGNLPGTSGGISGRLSWKKQRLKQLIYQRVFQQFGPFTFRPDGMNSQVNLMHPMLLPPHDEYRGEDYVSGKYHDAMLYIADAQLVAHLNEKRKSIFRGLFITIDISDPQARIRSHFKGRTALIEQRRRNVQYIKERFAGYQTVQLNDPQLDQEFLIHATDVSEAKSFINPTLIESLKRLGFAMTLVTEREPHWDDAVVEMLEAPLRPRIHDIDEESEVSDAIYSINNSIQCSFYEDKIQLTVPYRHHLFETPSLFAPPLDKNELFVMFCVMDLLKEIIAHFDTVKRAIDKPYPGSEQA